MRKPLIIKVAFFVFVSILFFSARNDYSNTLSNDAMAETKVEVESDDKIVNFYDGDVLVSSFTTQKYKDKNVLIIRCVPESKSDKLFVGWVRDNDDTVYKNGMIIAVKNNIDFYAKYEMVDIDECLEKYLNDENVKDNDVNNNDEEESIITSTFSNIE